MKRRIAKRIAIITGIIVLVVLSWVSVEFKPWQPPIVHPNALEPLFQEADDALTAYYDTHKAYPDSLSELKMKSNLAPYLHYKRTGNASCRLIYFSFGGIRVDTPRVTDP